MKIKKYIGMLALGLGIGLLYQPSIYASEPISSENFITIENNKIHDDLNKRASANELKIYNDYLEKSKDLTQNEKESFEIPVIGKEFNQRLDLLKSIKDLENIDPSFDKEVLKESYEILNGNDLTKIESQSISLKTHLIQKQLELKDNEKSKASEIINLDEKNLENLIEDYLKDGKLIYDKKETNKENLDQFIEAIRNSRSYYLADDKLKEKYDLVLDKVANNQDNISESYKFLENFVDASDKLSYGISDENKEIVTLTNNNFNASNDISSQDENTMVETTTIENESQNAEPEPNTNQSPFATNPKTSSKYNELTDPQKRELDAIDTDKNGIISNVELDNSANFTSDIPNDHFLYPFTEKGQNEEDSISNGSTTESNTNTSQSENTNTNSQKSDIPQTVTIDNSTKSPQLSNSDGSSQSNENNKDQEEENREDKTESNENWNEAEASSNTQAASVVKTGVTGIATVALVLGISLGLYRLLFKEKSKN